jgi:hypothetical protein
MAKFSSLTLTDAGYKLQVKAQTGVKLEFTRVALGDGVLSTGTSLNTLTALISEKQTSNIDNPTIGDGSAEIKANFSNKDLTASYYLRELGIFAQDPDAGEILYAVANAGDAADYMPAYGGAETIEQVFTIELSVGNVANVTAVFAESVYVLKAGDTMTGPLILSGDPSADLQATTKQYVDKSLTGYVPFGGGNLTGAINETLISIPAANVTDIGSVKANTIIITGTNPITAFGTAVPGARRTVIFNSSLTLTYNSASLILPGNLSISTRPGDAATFISLGNGCWQCISYSANSDSVYGQIAVAGSSILVVSNDIERAFSSSARYNSGSYTKSFIVKRAGTYLIYFAIKSPSGATITVSSNYSLSTYPSSSQTYVSGNITTSVVPAGSTITVSASISGGYSSGYTGYLANCRLYVGSWLGAFNDMALAT